MALVQGIYDLGEPGREAKLIEFKRLVIRLVYLVKRDRSMSLSLSVNAKLVVQLL
jgi:hypothetical protein